MNGNFVQHPPADESVEPYDYTEGMELVSIPMLFLTGDKDLAPLSAIERYGLDGVSSEVKKPVSLPGYGHTDLLVGRNAYRDVYPLLSDWMGAE